VDGRGREVRLFGTNICDVHVMPPAELAEPIARRLRELGFNFIRLHYYDYAPAPDGLMNDDMRTLNPAKLDQMDRLVSELKRHGIYIDLNLHVARNYPDQPEGWAEMGKVLDRVSPALIQDQKDFARQLLTHVNAYTGVAYADEPAIAIVEINNENSALLSTSSGNAMLFGSLPDTHRLPIKAQWNVWLQGRYESTDALRAAWDGDLREIGDEVLRNPDFAQDTAEWEHEASGIAEGSVEVRETHGGPVLTWSATRRGSEQWNHQLHQTDVAVEDGVPYVLSFRARSDDLERLTVSVMHQESPWETVAGPSRFELADGWQNFEVAWV
ncbi:MAG: carbohydrate binding domain-containing protein, partial [Planctomycetota bacterium]